MDWVSTAFRDGERRRSGELSEDNSSSIDRSMSSGTTASLPLSGLDGGSGRGGPRDFLAWLASNRVRRRSSSSRNRFACSRNSAIYLACSSCLASISWRQRRNWSSGERFVGLLDMTMSSDGMFENGKGFGDREITWERVYPSSHVSPLRFLARRFPQTAPIIVYRILRVSGSSGHSPVTSQLQPTKQTRR